MLFLADVFLPITMLPDWLQPITRALPLTPLSTLLRDVIFGVSLEGLWRFGLMAGWIVVAGLVIVKFFRWE